jgi:hypothetical protein
MGAKHRVGRVLIFSPVVGIGTPPHPHPQARVPPPPLVPGGGAHSLAAEGVGESQFRRGDIHTTVVLGKARDLKNIHLSLTNTNSLVIKKLEVKKKKHG